MATPEKARAVNKVVINDKTVVDMTEDTAVAADVVSGKFFHSKSGAQLAGTMRGLSILANSYLNPTTQATTFTIPCINSGNTGYVLGEEAQSVSVVLDKVLFGAVLKDQVLEGKTFTSTAGIRVAGTMPNKGAAAIELSDLNAKAVDAGYYSGGTAKIADAEAAKVIPGNIKKGITLFGVEGTLQDGPYNIVSTDNADGSQNLAITDAGDGGIALPTATITYVQEYKSISYTNSQGVYTTVTPNGVAGEISDALKGTLVLVFTMSGGTRPRSSGEYIGQLSDNVSNLGYVYCINSASISFARPAASGGAGD